MSNSKQKIFVAFIKAFSFIDIGITVFMMLPYLMHSVSNDTAQQNTVAVWIGYLSIIYIMLLTGLKLATFTEAHRDIDKGVK